MHPGSGHLGAVLLNRVTAEHKGELSGSRSRRSKATDPTRDRRARYPLFPVAAVDPGSRQRILVALPRAETGKTDQEFIRRCGDDDDRVIADGFGQRRQIPGPERVGAGLRYEQQPDQQSRSKLTSIY